jgi:hypothetical protein
MVRNPHSSNTPRSAELTNADYFRLYDDYIRRELQIAFGQVDRGEVSDLDLDAVLAEAHRRYETRG